LIKTLKILKYKEKYIKILSRGVGECDSEIRVGLAKFNIGTFE
jgi:hypothetical protein